MHSKNWNVEPLLLFIGRCGQNRVLSTVEAPVSDGLSSIEVYYDSTCVVCLEDCNEPPRGLVVSKRRHVICLECYLEYRRLQNSRSNSSCPTCASDMI